MILYQQVFTSASRGLHTSSQGLATVACHPQIPLHVRQYTEELAYPENNRNRQPIYCYAWVGEAGEEWVVLNRTLPIHSDHTARSNSLSHTFTAPLAKVKEWLEDLHRRNKELPTPAGFMLALNKTGKWLSAWDEASAKTLGEAPLIEADELLAGVNNYSGGWKDPALGLNALHGGLPKKLRWNWPGDSLELLARYHQAQRAVDPFSGKEEQRKLATIRCTWTLIEAWSCTFATLLMASQQSDHFLWFATADNQSSGVRADRDLLDPDLARILPDDEDKAKYIRDADGQLNSELIKAYDEASQAFKAAVEEAEKVLKVQQDQHLQTIQTQSTAASEHLDAINKWKDLVHYFTQYSTETVIAGADASIKSASVFRVNSEAKHFDLAPDSGDNISKAYAKLTKILDRMAKAGFENVGLNRNSFEAVQDRFQNQLNQAKSELADEKSKETRLAGKLKVAATNLSEDLKKFKQVKAPFIPPAPTLVANPSREESHILSDRSPVEPEPQRLFSGRNWLFWSTAGVAIVMTIFAFCMALQVRNSNKSPKTRSLSEPQGHQDTVGTKPDSNNHEADTSDAQLAVSAKKAHEEAVIKASSAKEAHDVALADLRNAQKAHDGTASDITNAKKVYDDAVVEVTNYQKKSDAAVSSATEAKIAHDNAVSVALEAFNQYTAASTKVASGKGAKPKSKAPEPTTAMEEAKAAKKAADDKTNDAQRVEDKAKREVDEVSGKLKRANDKVKAAQKALDEVNTKVNEARITLDKATAKEAAAKQALEEANIQETKTKEALNKANVKADQHVQNPSSSHGDSQ